MSGVYHEPAEYLFRDRDGHDGKTFGTDSPTTQHLIIECRDRLTVSMRQNACEFSYYVIEGNGYFMLDGEKRDVNRGDLVLVSPGTKYSFGGNLRMLLINTPRWNEEQEEVFHEN